MPKRYNNPDQFEMDFDNTETPIHTPEPSEDEKLAEIMERLGGEKARSHFENPKQPLEPEPATGSEIKLSTTVRPFPPEYKKTRVIKGFDMQIVTDGYHATVFTTSAGRKLSMKVYYDFKENEWTFDDKQWNEKDNPKPAGEIVGHMKRAVNSVYNSMIEKREDEIRRAKARYSEGDKH